MMVAYSFKTRFLGPIGVGTKAHTIRLPRKNPHPSRASIGGHAKPGEKIQIYTGMRTKHCRLIGTAECEKVHRITIELCHSWVDLYEVPGKKPRRLNCWDGSAIELDPFARSDGFKDWSDLWEYWAAEYPEANHRAGDFWLFDGFLIGWKNYKGAPRGPDAAGS
jgi:hypothetical protein